MPVIKPFGMTDEEQTLLRAAEDARRQKRMDELSGPDRNRVAPPGGYRAGAEWDVFSNALKGKNVKVSSLKGLKAAVKR